VNEPRRAAPSLRDVLSGTGATVSGSRKLTDDEKAKVREWALNREMARHPNAKVTITVLEELDPDGHAR
jgi:hypothetical protein